MYFTETCFHFTAIFCWILLKMRNVSNKVVGKIETHTVCSVTFFRKLCLLWDNVEKRNEVREAEYDNMARARWMLDKYRYMHHADALAFEHARTHREMCNTYCFSTATMIRKIASCCVVRMWPACLYYECVWRVMKCSTLNQIFCT
jgi:hypothetical protein